MISWRPLPLGFQESASTKFWLFFRASPKLSVFCQPGILLSRVRELLFVICDVHVIVPLVKLLTPCVYFSDLVVLFYGILGNNMSEYLMGVAQISYAVSNIVDGWIYIFLQPRVSRLVKRNFLACIAARIRDGGRTNEPSEVYSVSRNGIENLPTSVITTSSFM